MVIITGSTSFIGRNVPPLLLKHFKKSEILSLCWNKDEEVGVKNRKKLERAGFPIKFVDLVTKDGLKNIPRSPEIIIHMAANTDTSSSDHKVNDFGTKNLIKSLGKLGPKTHIIYTSTTTFLGGRKNCSQPLDETSKEFPTNEYGRSKLRAEKYLISECKKRKFRLTILRLNTVYGPDSRPKSMFKILPEQIRRGSLFTRLNWPGKTSIVHVDDVTQAIIYFCKNKIPKPGVSQIFILTGESLTMADISKIMHREMEIKYMPINLPSVFWQTAKFGRKFIPNLESILPHFLYNPFWRASLIIDNALWFETQNIGNVMPTWKPKLLQQTVNKLV